MSTAKILFRTCLALAFALITLGCTSTATDGAPKFQTAAAAHPTTWLDTHYVDFITTPDQCRTCHGNDLQGGTSNVTCFQCHHPNGPSHRSGWGAAAQHGRNGAQLAPSASAGFAACTKCHGTTYDNPVGTTPSCKACHTKAPHPNKPWNGSTASTPNHTFTATGNAPECNKCHANGANSKLKPSFPAPAGTAPGCFNNTMCHGADIPH